MKELIGIFEIEQYKQELREQRLKEQKQNKDYDYDTDSNMERCHDCGRPLNSHGWCNRCDY